MDIKQPTADQCTNHEKVGEDNQNIAYAMWYPQMGGYVAMSVAVIDKEWTHNGAGSSIGGCIEMYVWHDGSFPFNEDDSDDRQPAHLHHCDAEQFIRFGQKLHELNQAQGRLET